MNNSLQARLSAQLEQLLQGKVGDYVYWSLFGFFSIFLILPLWTITYLPLGDLPDHAAQLHAILNFSEYSADYKINWLTPYLVGYSISILFGAVFSAVTALKITYTLSVLAIPLATALLLNKLEANRYWVFPSFASAFSFSFYWGFFSYVIATPLAIAFFAFCVGYGRSPRNYKNFLFAAFFSALLFFAHAMAWAFSMAAAVAILLVNNNLGDVKRKLLPFLVLLPVVAIWFSSNEASQSSRIEPGNFVAHVSDKVGNELGYIAVQFKERTIKHEHKQRFLELISYSIGKQPLSDYIAASLILLFWPLIMGAKLTRNWRRWLPPLCAVGAFMIIPYWIFDTAYVNLRFAVFLFPLSLFLFEQDKLKNPIERYGLPSFGCRFLLGIGLVCGTLLLNYATLSSFKQNDDDFAFVLDKMSPNKTVLALMFDQDSALTFSPAYMHYGSYYQAEKGGIAVPSFSHDPMAHNVPLRFKNTPWTLPSSWNPERFDWKEHSGDRYDYFLIRSKKPRDELFSASGGTIKLLASKGDWLLYGKM